MEEALHRLSQELGTWLQRHGHKLATAESCTGGWIAAVVTATAGSSEWFERGFVTYSNAAKQEMLGVSADTLEQVGAVSEATVREMVAGALAHSPADIALAVSGIAGPDGGTPQKPVGTVCFAWGGRDNIDSTTVILPGDRNAVRRQAVVIALEGIMKRL